MEAHNDVKPLASGTILPSARMRWTPTPRKPRRASGWLPRSEISFAVEFRTLLFAGLLWGAVWIARSYVQP